MTDHQIVVTHTGPNVTTATCTCSAELVAKHPRTMADVFRRHCARMRKKKEAARLISFIDAHGGRLGAFRGYPVT
jgi:hypothetical protein